MNKSTETDSAEGDAALIADAVSGLFHRQVQNDIFIFAVFCCYFSCLSISQNTKEISVAEISFRSELINPYGSRKNVDNFLRLTAP